MHFIFTKEFTDHQFLTNHIIFEVGCTCPPFTSDISHLPRGMFQEVHEWLGRRGICQNDDPNKTTSVLHSCETTHQHQCNLSSNPQTIFASSFKEMSILNHQKLGVTLAAMLHMGHTDHTIRNGSTALWLQGVFPDSRNLGKWIKLAG